jgi:hypothetical protein
MSAEMSRTVLAQRLGVPTLVHHEVRVQEPDDGDGVARGERVLEPLDDRVDRRLVRHGFRFLGLRQNRTRERDDEGEREGRKTGKARHEHRLLVREGGCGKSRG